VSDSIPSPLSVLIVDDDASLLGFLAFFFEDKGFAVHTARDGVEAIELARRHRPPVIITDLMMGQMHGFELIRQVRADPALDRAIVIAMSAKAFKSDQDKVRALGANDYVVKPFQIDELFELVQRRLDEQNDAGAL
jgi:two-component system, OmpR family, phosphate regulon response regulator PhoB